MKIKKLLLLGAVLFISSCGTTSKFVYPSNAKNLVMFSEKDTINKKVVVVPFEDLRPDRNIEAYWVSYVPIMPVGWADYERPDAARRFLTIAEFEFHPSEDLAKAAAFSLKKSKLFNDAFFSYGGDKDKADYVLEGEIESTRYTGKIISYGVSVFGQYLWYAGLPSGTSNNSLSLAIKLKDSKTNKIIWESSYALTKSIVQGMYYNHGHDAKGYASLMEEVMNGVVESLKVELKK